MRRRSHIIRIVSISGYVLFLLYSFGFGFDPGKMIAANFASFSLDMLKVLPCAFILIGLFEVWVRRETVERHLGEGSGLAGHLWVVLLAGTTVGGLYVAFPIAYSLFSKGAKFTAIRLLVSIPIVIITSELLGRYLMKRSYAIVDGSVG
jgi:uncharacterized membrane protein YraQ (UPF0718 family)